MESQHFIKTLSEEEDQILFPSGLNCGDFSFLFCVFGEFVLLKTSSRVAVCLFSAQFKSMHEAFKDTAEFCGAFKKREAARVEKTQTNSLSLSVFNIYRINDVMSFKLRPLCTNSFMP